jgi:hypothetical protein
MSRSEFIIYTTIIKIPIMQLGKQLSISPQDRCVSCFIAIDVEYYASISSWEFDR